MKNISANYVVHPGTMALIPSKQIAYETLVLEEEKSIPVKPSPFHLIQTSCLEYFSTYEGRRLATIYHTGFRRKVPIPIGPNQIMFPTHAVKAVDCAWISSNHIVDILPPYGKTSTILFKNGTTVNLPVSANTLEKQIKRAEICRQQYFHIIKELRSTKQFVS